MPPTKKQRVKKNLFGSEPRPKPRPPTLEQFEAKVAEALDAWLSSPAMRTKLGPRNMMGLRFLLRERKTQAENMRNRGQHERVDDWDDWWTMMEDEFIRSIRSEIQFFVERFGWRPPSLGSGRWVRVPKWVRDIYVKYNVPERRRLKRIPVNRLRQ